MTDQELLETLRFLEATPETVCLLSADLSDQLLRWKPSPGEFSALEQVCHLRDLELEGYASRIRRLLTDDHPSLPDFDGTLLAREREYNSQDFESGLRGFKLAREDNLRVLRGMTSEQLNRTGVLAGVGRITLGQLITMMRAHDLSHLDELANLRSRMARNESLAGSA